MSRSTCENPQYPTWTWRYNRDKHLSEFQPWYTRVDQWPPRYRHMGVPYGFRFSPMDGSEGGPVQQTGVSYAKNLNFARETGSGNAALGNPPGPAPPRIVMHNSAAPYPVPELYRVNEIAGISGGMSMWDHAYLSPNQPDSDSPPLDPKQYLQETLGQTIEYPGTFPHFSIQPATTGPCPPRICKAKGDDGPRNPLAVWTDRHRMHQRGHAMEKMRASTGGRRFLPSIQSGMPSLCGQYAQRPASTSVVNDPCEGIRRNLY